MEEEATPEKIKSLDVTVTNTTQLAIVSSANGSNPHSVLLVRHNENEMVIVDGLVFRLAVSIHIDMPIQTLVEAMESHYRYVTESEQSVVGESREFEPNKQSIIYKKLKGLTRATGSRVKAEPNRQWLLSFNNHRVLQYFIRQFRRPFRINHHRCDVRVLRLGVAKYVSFFAVEDNPTTYVLDQLNTLNENNDDVLHWRFSRYTTPQSCDWSIQHGLAGDDDDAMRKDAFAWADLWRFGQRHKNRFSICTMNFSGPQLERVCHYVHCESRTATVLRDLKAPIKYDLDKKKTLNTTMVPETAHDKWAREQFARRTSKERELGPGKQYKQKAVNDFFSLKTT